MAFIALALLTSSPAAPSEPQPVPDAPFVQESHEPRLLPDGPRSNDVRAVAVDALGAAWAATGAGVYVLAEGEPGWRPQADEGAEGPAFDVLADSTGNVWAGVWNGLWRCRREKLEKVARVDSPIAALASDGRILLAAGPDGLWRVADGGAERQPLPCSRGVRALLPDPEGGLWFATGLGLHLEREDRPLDLQTGGGPLTTDVRGIAFARDGSLWSVGLGGAVVYRGGKVASLHTPASGLPSSEASCVTRGPDGRMWVGTSLGVARFNGKAWSLRHSRRWLLDDEVRDVAFGPDGSAWVATAAGVSVLRVKETTLAAKAEHFLAVCVQRHVREPGLVEKCRLREPGNVATWEPQDDDNDGGFTATYMAMQSFRYAVTKDPAAREAAARAFRALRFLQAVTGTRSFFARTVVPSTWSRMADPNDSTSDPEWADRRIRDPRAKRVEKRWRPSADGKWLWKGDTSSDEVTAHMYGYLIYHDLAADEKEKELVREQVARIVDGIIEGGFVLRDIDGEHTRWAVWAPEKLNRDPDWAPERGVNSVEILSYLKLACHVTGDPKYEEAYRRLLRGHRYDLNVRRAKTTNPSWRTHIDDELLALAYPALLLHERDPELRALYLESLDHWHDAVKDDHSPFFDFTYRTLSGKDLDLEGALEFLRDAPLDLVRWTVDNSRREDLRLVRVPEIEHVQTDRLPPASERGVMRWDDNPWRAVQGDGGRTESDGVYWLLPYWMGRHLGLLQGPR